MKELLVVSGLVLVVVVVGTRWRTQQSIVMAMLRQTVLLRCRQLQTAPLEVRQTAPLEVLQSAPLEWLQTAPLENEPGVAICVRGGVHR